MAGESLIELPPALAPWSRELAIFPREMALALGPVVRRLAALIGSAIPSRAVSGEPDGFDGLARRGTYERLLHSEWLLADELPEEFARRAAMHEHLFMAVARQQLVQHPLAVALFDCGPSQIGTPRLAHIAALIVLARRAAAAEAAFRWGVLQEPDRLFDDITTANIGSFLEARTSMETMDVHVDTWRKALETNAGDDDAPPVGELWLVGPSRLSRFGGARQQWHLQVEDARDPEKERLRAAVRHEARHDPPVLLDLPARDVCTRLLRDPFASRTGVPRPKRSRRYKIASNLQFDSSGRVVLGMSDSGSLVVQPFPNSANAQTSPRPKFVVIRHGHPLAATWFNRSPIYAVANTSGVWIERHSNDSERRHHPKSDGGAFPVHDETLRPLVVTKNYVNQRQVHELLFADAAGDLWRSSDEQKLDVIGSGVAALWLSSLHGKLTIHRADGSWYVWRVLSHTHLHRRPGAGRHAFFGYSGAPRSHGGNLVVALEMDDKSWLVIDGKSEYKLSAPDGCEVVGIARDPLTHQQMSLVWIDEDRRGVNAGAARHWRTSTPIRHAVTTPAQPHIAWVTTSGDLEVFSLATGQTLFRSIVLEDPR